MNLDIGRSGQVDMKSESLFVKDKTIARPTIATEVKSIDRKVTGIAIGVSC